MEPLALASVLAGVALVALGLVDIFLTILHPDRDGPVSIAVNRATWRGTVAVASGFPSVAHELIALAGGLMIAMTIALWIALHVVGFALIALPFLATHFMSAHPGPPGFMDAVYWSGVTFTTLGYGDYVPATPLWKALALLNALLGFSLVGAAIAFLMSVFQGIEHRDRMALRIYSETRRTWDGTVFLSRVLSEEGPSGLLERVGKWADEMRNLHERLYRFQPLAFYVRTRSEKHSPERMLMAVAEVALAARVLSHSSALEGLQPVADEIDIAYTEFALSAVRHQGSRRAIRLMEHPEPNDEDRAAIAAVRRRVWAELRLPDLTDTTAEEERETLELAARMRVFLDELDRITHWRAIQRLS